MSDNKEYKIIDVGEDNIELSVLNDRLHLLENNLGGLSKNISALPFKRFTHDFLSLNFKEGEKGWKISDNGDVEFNDGTFRGSVSIGDSSGRRIEIENNVIKSYETNGLLRFSIDGDVIEFYDPSETLSSALYGANIATDGVDGLTVLLTPSSRLTISSITRSVGTAIVTTSTAHGASTGWFVTVQGADQTDYNISTEIIVTSSTVFTYTVANSPTTPATGTMYCRVYPDYYLFSGAGFTMSGGTFTGDLLINTGSTDSIVFGDSGVITPDSYITYTNSTSIFEFTNDSGGVKINSAGDITIANSAGDLIINVAGDIHPNVNDDISLGNSLRKWSDVQSVLINGAAGVSGTFTSVTVVNGIVTAGT